MKGGEQVKEISVADRLKSARQRKGCPAKATADACGITENAVYMYENGYRVPRDEIKKKLAEFYGISIPELFF